MISLPFTKPGCGEQHMEIQIYYIKSPSITMSNKVTAQITENHEKLHLYILHPLFLPAYLNTYS